MLKRSSSTIRTLGGFTYAVFSPSRSPCGGCQADLPASGTEGLRLLKQKSYHLVLTDSVMAGGSGLELVENVRTSDADVGVIMLTASGADLDGHGRRLGFKLLRKPLQIDRLEAAVKQALSEWKARAAAGAPAP